MVFVSLECSVFYLYSVPNPVHGPFLLCDCVHVHVVGVLCMICTHYSPILYDTVPYTLLAFIHLCMTLYMVS